MVSVHLFKVASIFTNRSSLLYTLTLLSIVCLSTYYTFHHHRPPPPPRRSSDQLRTFRQLFLNSSSNTTISSFLLSLTSHPHLAGTPPATTTVDFVATHFSSSGLRTHIAGYKALLSYPVQASLTAHFIDGTWKYMSLVEKGVASDVVIPYHAYSPSGSVAAKAVYVNYGREEDYRSLRSMGVEVKGCVALARRGELPRGDVVRRAAAEGAVAFLLYAEADGGGIERGTVMAGGLGDPQTPGWASVDGAERLPSDDDLVTRRFPPIPSLPISAENARVILSSLGGPHVPAEWMGSTGESKWSGVGPGPTMLNFTYKVMGWLL